MYLLNPYLYPDLQITQGLKNYIYIKQQSVSQIGLNDHEAATDKNEILGNTFNPSIKHEDRTQARYIRAHGLISLNTPIIIY